MRLLEAKIVNVSYITNENIMASLTSAKRLTLSSTKINYSTGTIFYQLVYQLILKLIEVSNFISFFFFQSYTFRSVGFEMDPTDMCTGMFAVPS
ncbi:unnamed protein product [Arabis nemorensis]|uniref:Uncharacterized protein n=1 Tax=Arabis nemorensis TaxID=586526 RepID=A0A565ATW0_9BRAS|nr:unnamed protein product [Arabis nemorensis]